MRFIVTILALLFVGNTVMAADKQTGELVCRISRGAAVKNKITKIICEDVGYERCTEYTNVTLKLRNLTMNVSQVFEKISIEVRESGRELLSIDAKDKVTASLGVVGSPDSINASCVIIRN